MATSPLDAIGAALTSAKTLRQTLARGKSVQVRAGEERDLVQATAEAWFRQHRSVIPASHAEILRAPDKCFADLLKHADRATTRARYLSDLKTCVGTLTSSREALLLERPPSTSIPLQNAAPDFAPLVSDPLMRAILARRWNETGLCIGVGAHLAATVMMGGLVEALLLARMNRVVDKRPIFTAKAAPKDSGGKTRPQSEWTLQHYIDVSHELGWIRPSAKDVGVVLRDYRNYIHPAKELSHGITLNSADTAIFWEVCKQLSTQIIQSATIP